ncbi:hypothetical protein DWB85_18060 [Seongchinamella sediminis]|uniref:Uncharacterized protein n=1 Tax=Seongchinamella sediminis TaxID=2283635 RepID=A0A3L7DVM5_9GAMM|nr:hypothetical protein [Seongchinamella sediminis]RLQ20353.1 hypothetical protein DWB85_18060 [Seongchinamella sediminis]
METLVYVLKADQALTVAHLRERLLGEIVTGLRSLGDFVDDERYFGSEEAANVMIGHLPGFCDLGSMVSLAMSEYYFE